MKEYLFEQDLYRTSDLGIASALSLFVPVISVDINELGKAEFSFDRQKLNDLVEEYWKGELRVEPQRYFQQIKAMKSRIYSGF